MGCSSCNQRKARVASYAPTNYVVLNQSGEVIKEFGNRTEAAFYMRNNPVPGYHLNKIETK